MSGINETAMNIIMEGHKRQESHIAKQKQPQMGFLCCSGCGPAEAFIRQSSGGGGHETRAYVSRKLNGLGGGIPIGIL